MPSIPTAVSLPGDRLARLVRARTPFAREVLLIPAAANLREPLRQVNAQPLGGGAGICWGPCAGGISFTSGGIGSAEQWVESRCFSTEDLLSVDLFGRSACAVVEGAVVRGVNFPV